MDALLSCVLISLHLLGVASTAAPTSRPSGLPTSLPSVTSYAEWTYVATTSSCAGTNADPCGMEYWGTIDDASACDADSQSPINIAGAVIVPDLDYPTFVVHDGGCADWVQSSKEATFEVDFHHDACHDLSVTYAETEYTLEQMHFHSPSEHSIGGGYYSAEVHLEHHDGHGKYLMLGIMLEVAAVSHFTPPNNTFLNRLWETHDVDDIGAEVHRHEATHPLNPYASLMPASPIHFQYNGSFTTPPCTEGVQWLVYNSPVSISPTDLQLLRNSIGGLSTTTVNGFGHNNRFPTQARNGRVIQMYTGASYLAAPEAAVADDHAIDDHGDDTDDHATDDHATDDHATVADDDDEVARMATGATSMAAASIVIVAILLCSSVCLFVQVRQARPSSK